MILGRGLGTRMQAADPGAALDPEQARAAAAGVKTMMPLAYGRPFLDWVLSALADSGIREVCLVIGPEHDAVRRYYSALTLTRIRITTAVQERALGTADAVLAAESFAAGQTLLVLNADNYYPVDAYRALRTLGAAGLVAFDRGALVAGGAIPAERIAEYALVQTDEHGMLRRIVEKPDAATLQRWTAPALVSMNLWALPSEIYAACRAIGPSARGERELPGAVQYCIDRYCVEFRAVPMRGAVLDLSSRRDVAEVAARLAGVRPVL